jgi:hypothetical protein
MALELWDTTTSNLIGEYPDEAAVMREISQLIESRGEAFVSNLVLAYEATSGRSDLVVVGAVLIRQAQAESVKPHAPRSRRGGVAVA